MIIIFSNHHINYLILTKKLLFSDKSKSSSSPGAEEGNSPRSFGAPDVWRKYRIDPGKVNQWTANLRMVIVE